MLPTQKWPLRERPLNLAEVLRLRNGMALPKENLSGFAAQKILPKSRNNPLVGPCSP